MKFIYFSKRVKTVLLQEFHKKSLKEIFIVENFINKINDNAPLKKKEEFLKKTKLIEQLLKKIIYSSIFQEFSEIRINELYYQLKNSEILKLEFDVIKIRYNKDPEYLTLFNTRIEERLFTFKLIPNNTHL